MKKMFFGITLLLAVLLVAGCNIFSPQQAEVAAPDTKVKEVVEDVKVVEEEIAEDVDAPADVIFDISGRNYAFSEIELRAKKGDKVKVIFTSADGFHNWTVDEFNAATEQVQTGGRTEVTFIADKAGTFEYYCSVGNHRELGMVGNLIVE